MCCFLWGGVERGVDARLVWLCKGEPSCVEALPNTQPKSLVLTHPSIHPSIHLESRKGALARRCGYRFHGVHPAPRAVAGARLTRHNAGHISSLMW
jgi:hypothetical protein